MKRRRFLQASLLTLPVVSQAVALGLPLKPVPTSFTVKAGQDRFNQPILFKGVNPNLVKISGKDTGGQLAVFEYIGLQKTGPALHVHFQQDEIFYVVEGEYLFQVGEEKQTLRAGDTIFLPRNVPHTWLQLTDKGKLHYQVQPAGKMEAFFQKMDTFKGPPTEEEVNQVHVAHDMKVLGPPLAMK